VLKLEDEPLKEPSDGEVRLKVESVSIALKLASGQANFRTARTFPSTLGGYEATDAIGTGVSGLQIGERVSTIPAFSMRKYGVYGESVIVPASAVAHYPKKTLTERRHGNLDAVHYRIRSTGGV